MGPADRNDRPSIEIAGRPATYPMSAEGECDHPKTGNGDREKEPGSNEPMKRPHDHLLRDAENTANFGLPLILAKPACVLVQPAVRPEGRLPATVVFHSAQQNAYPLDRAVEHGLGNPGDRAGIPDVDNGGAMLRGSPRAKFSLNDLQDLEAGKNPVVGLRPKDKIEFRFDRQLRDSRRTE